MSEILDEQVPEVQPEQKPEAFRQGVSEPEPVAPPAPEPQPEPEPEPEPIVPDWLNAPSEPEPAPNYPPQAPPQYPHNQPQYPPQQERPLPAGDISAFIDNPDAYIEQRANQLLEQRLGPIAYQQQLIMQRNEMTHQSQVASSVASADAAIQRAYEKFNKDSAFRSDKRVQESIKNMLSNMRQQAAIEAANTGNFTKLYNMANIGDREIQATLAVAKIQAGTASSSAAPLDILGAEVASTQPSTPKPQIQLTKDQEAIAARFGDGYADRLRQAIAETNDAGDFEG